MDADDEDEDEDEDVEADEAPSSLGNQGFTNLPFSFNGIFSK